MSDFEVLFPIPENRRNSDDMGMPSPVAKPIYWHKGKVVYHKDFLEAPIMNDDTVEERWTKFEAMIREGNNPAKNAVLLEFAKPIYFGGVKALISELIKKPCSKEQGEVFERLARFGESL